MNLDQTAQSPVRAALAHPAFRRLLAALAVSQAGDWLYNLALLALVYDRTHSSTWVAVTTAARVVPMLVASPVGGVLADRWDRRGLMVVSDLVRTACMLGLAAVAAQGLPILLAPVLAATATLAAGPYPSCVAATTPRLVPDSALAGANAARVAVGMVCMIAGPGFGALLLLLGSPTFAFVLNAGTFVVSALLVLSLPSGEHFRPGREDGTAGLFTGVFTGVVEGVTALRAQPEAMRLVGADVMCSMVYGAHTVLLLLVARRLGLGDAGYGYLLAAVGVGGVLGTAVAGRLAAAVTGRRSLVLLAGLTVAVPATALGVCFTLPAVLACAVLIGLGSVVVEVSADTALQRCLAPEVLARAYGVAYPAAIVGIAGGALVAGPLAVHLGLSGALCTVGVAMGAYVALLAVGGSRTAAATAEEPAYL